MAADIAVEGRITASRGAGFGDRLFHALTLFFAAGVLLVLGGVIAALVSGALPALEHFGFGFVVADVWNPVTERFGALAPIYGTVVTSAIAMLIGIPVAFGIALFITELSPVWLKRPLATMIELLAAIPSIIYGIWGLFVLAPFVQEYIEPALINTVGEIPGIGLLCRSAARHRRLDRRVHSRGDGAAVYFLDHARRVRDRPAHAEGERLGLGATTSEVVWRVVLPFARIGIFGGILWGSAARSARRWRSPL